MAVSYTHLDVYKRQLRIPCVAESVVLNTILKINCDSDILIITDSCIRKVTGYRIIPVLGLSLIHI